MYAVYFFVVVVLSLCVCVCVMSVPLVRSAMFPQEFKNRDVTGILGTDSGKQTGRSRRGWDGNGV